MRFCVQAGWFLQSVDSIPWYVPYSPSFSSLPTQGSACTSAHW